MHVELFVKTFSYWIPFKMNYSRLVQCCSHKGNLKASVTAGQKYHYKRYISKIHNCDCGKTCNIWPYFSQHIHFCVCVSMYMCNYLLFCSWHICDRQWSKNGVMAKYWDTLLIFPPHVSDFGSLNKIISHVSSHSFIQFNLNHLLCCN